MSQKDILNPQIINKIYNEYNIKLIPQIDSLYISIQSIIHLIFINHILIYNIYIHSNYLF